ncbi:MAG TPA: hypothetical protein ENH82_05765, partial [bacterium]|nr:hypothetical protein [bacterium]
MLCIDLLLCYELLQVQEDFMKIGKKIIITTILLCFAAGMSINAEEYPEWEGYPPMFSINDVIEFNGYAYGVCESGIFIYDPLTKEYKLFYKNHGLAAYNVLSIAATSNEIYIGFKYDGLMRFEPEDETFEPILFPEYVDNENILNTLAINDIYALNDSILYIGHSKGIDKLNLNTEELHTFTKLSMDIQEDTPVKKVRIFKDRIWACTPDGLAWADVNNPNLEFEENWESIKSTKFGAGVNCIINFINDDEDKIFVGTDGSGIFTLDIENKEIERVSSIPIIFSFSNAFGTCFAASSAGLLKKSFNTWFLPDITFLALKVLSPEINNKIWVATSDNGLQCYTRGGYIEIPPINGLGSSTFRKIDITKDNVVWAATSSRSVGGNVQRFQDGLWVSYNKEDGLPSTYDDEKPITISVYVDNNGTVWGATWGRGIYIHDDNGTQEKEDDVITRVDPEIEIILPYENEGFFVVCPDMTGDKYGNIWVAGWDQGVYVLEGNLPIREYKYYHFLFNDSGTRHYVRRAFADDDGWVWLGTWETGLIALYVGEDPYDTSDDKTVFISSVDGLLGNRIEAIHTDKDGYVWIGTDGGLNRIKKLPGNELSDVENMNYLFGEESAEVNSIEIDRFNNKWFGTSTGLIKLDSDNEQKQIYNTENSGIFFINSIFSLKYDDERDILWVGTDTGLNKFNVLEADSGDSGNIVHVYPNPFEIWGNNSRATFTNLKPNKT